MQTLKWTENKKKTVGVCEFWVTKFDTMYG